MRIERDYLFRLLVGIGFTAVLTGCQDVSIKTGDTGPPMVVIEVHAPPITGTTFSRACSDAPAYPAFADASAPSGGVFDEAIFTVRGDLTVGGSASQAHDQIDTSSTDPDTSSTLTSQ